MDMWKYERAGQRLGRCYERRRGRVWSPLIRYEVGDVYLSRVEGGLRVLQGHSSIHCRVVAHLRNQTRRESEKAVMNLEQNGEVVVVHFYGGGLIEGDSWNVGTELSMDLF